MIKTSIILIVVLSVTFIVSPCLPLCAQEHGISITDTLLSEDAIILTLRLQEGIWLDTTLAMEIDRVLEAARSTSDTLRSIHARCHYYDPYKIHIHCEASWTSAWIEGNLVTGNEAVDSLMLEYHMISVEGTGPIFSLQFDQPLNMFLLSALYGRIEGVDVFLAASLYGDDITIFKKHSTWHLVFTHVLGYYWYPQNCDEYYWYVLVDDGVDAQLIDERLRDPEIPWMYLWNVPQHYAATVFSTVNELLEVAQLAPEWWMRRHAIEVIRRLLFADTPWIEEDENDLNTFHTLREGIRSRRAEVYSTLRILIGDHDSDVKKSAQKALNRLLGFPEESLAFYYPLHVGNSWTYGWYTETIVDTQRIDGKIYFLFDGGTLKRVTDDDKLVVRRDSTEQVWVDFGAKIGDSWGSTVTLISKEEWVEVPAGFFFDCYHFSFIPEALDACSAEWYAPGVGVVKRWFCNTLYEFMLTHAVIDGLEISALKGDVNGNRGLEVNDILLIVNIIIGHLEPAPHQFWAADMNEDNRIDVLDVVELILDILGDSG